jgi:hypothetical protein
MSFRRSLSATSLFLALVSACTPNAPQVTAISLRATKTQLAPGDSVQIDAVVEGSLRPDSPTDSHARFSITSGQEAGALTVTQGPQTTFIASRSITSPATVVVAAVSEFDPTKATSLTLIINPQVMSTQPDSNPLPNDAGVPDAGPLPVQPDAGQIEPPLVDAGVPAEVTKITLSAAASVVETEGSLDIVALVDGTGDFSKALTWRVVQGLGALTESEALKATFRATNVPSQTTIDIEATSVSHPNVVGSISLTVLSKPTIKGFTVKALRDENGKTIPEGKGLPIGGGTVGLSWETSDAAAVEITPALGVVQADSIEAQVTGTTVFTLTVRNAVGSASQSAKITAENQGLVDELVSFNPKVNAVDYALSPGFATEQTAVDAQGNVYVAGTVSPGKGDLPNCNVFVAKYSRAGEKQWVQLKELKTNDCRSLQVSRLLATSAGVFVAGYGTPAALGSQTTSNEDVWVEKLNGDGTLAWFIGVTTGLDEYVSALTVDASGNVAIGGAAQQNNMIPDPSSQAYVIKLNGVDGGQMWYRHWFTGSEADATALATNATGDVYVGVQAYASGDENYYQIHLLRLSSEAGLLEPLAAFGTPAIDYVTQLAVDGENNVFLAGTTYGAFSTPFRTVNSGARSLDAWAAKYDAQTKQLVWLIQLGTPQDETSAGFLLDAAGHAYLAGSTYGNFANPLLPGQDRDGWVARLNASTGATEWLTQVSVQLDGAVQSLSLTEKGALRLAGSIRGVKADKTDDVWSTLIR